MPGTYDFVYNKIKKDLMLGSISGEYSGGNDGSWW